MRYLRPVIIRCGWEKHPKNWPIPPHVSSETLLAMFGQASGWGVGDLWQAATLDTVGFQPVIHDIGKLYGFGFDGSLDAAGNVKTPKRADVVQAAVHALESTGFEFGRLDFPIVMINPPPCDAGAVGVSSLGYYGVLLDLNGDHGFMAHEFGHAFLIPNNDYLDVRHSWGPAFGNPDTEYCHPYCVMSHSIYGYAAPYTVGPRVATMPADVPPRWTGLVAPLPTPALVQPYLAPERLHRVTLAIDDVVDLPLRAYGLSSSVAGQVLAVIEAGVDTWYLEHRMPVGWDAGIDDTSKLNATSGGVSAGVVPGTVVSRLNKGHVTYVGSIPQPHRGGEWWSPASDLRLAVIKSTHDGTRVVVRASRGATAGFDARVELSVVTDPARVHVGRSNKADLTPEESGICEPGTYQYTTPASDRDHSVVVTYWGLTNPTISWTINGVSVPVAPTSPQTISFDTIAAHPLPTGPALAQKQTVQLDADADGGGLWFRNRGREGNWHAEVSVTLSGDEGAVTRHVDVDVVGQQIKWEDRLATDAADCLRKMIGDLPVVPIPKWPKDGPFPGELRPGLGDLLNGLVDEEGATVDLRHTRAERLVATMFGLDIVDLRRIR